MLELERLGWEAWVATTALTGEEAPDFPPVERIKVARRGRWDARRVMARALPGVREELVGWWVRRALAELHPTVVHAHYGWSALEVAPVVHRRGVPLIVGLHGYDVTVWPRHGFGPVLAGQSPPPPDAYAELFSRASRVLVVSRFLESRLRDLGYTVPVEIVPSGTRLERYPFRGPHADDGSLRLLFIGRLVPYKGLDVLLRALPAVAEQVPATTLDVVGDGPERRAWTALVDQLGLNARVRFHGALSRAAVLERLHAADVLVAPSLTAPTGQAESLSNVVKEGLAVGLAVVASDSGGIPEAMAPAFRHELVPEGDPEALSARLLALHEERDGWTERAREGRRWIEEAFDWRKIAPRLAEIYREAASGAA